MMPAYWAFAAAGWAALTAAWWGLARASAAPDWKGRRAAWVVLGVAVVLRLPLAIFSEPHLSTDIWRYLFDGRNLSDGVNPYAVTPAEAIENSGTGDPWLRRVNNPTLATIYQPVSQLVFGIAAWVHRQTLGTPLGPVGLRLVFVAFDVGIVLLLISELRRRGRSVWWAVLYAWHPLAVTEVAWSGHQDVIGMLPMVACAAMVGRAAAVGGGLLAMSIAVKPVVAPLGVVFAVLGGRAKPQAASPQAWVGAWGVCVGVLVVVYAPFAVTGEGLGRMIETARVFTQGWLWNGSIHAMLHRAIGSKYAADAVCGVLLLGALVMIAARVRDAAEGAMLYLFAAVLLSSTVHPWYLLWSLALLPLCPSSWAAPAVWVLSLAITWSYAAVFTPDFHPPVWVVWVEYVPVYAALGWGAWRVLRSRTSYS